MATRDFILGDHLARARANRLDRFRIQPIGAVIARPLSTVRLDLDRGRGWNCNNRVDRVCFILDAER